MKLSQILKYTGIVIGAIGALRIVFAELELILQHPIALVITGLGAVCYFVGVWEARHEAAIAVANVSAPATTPVA